MTTQQITSAQIVGGAGGGTLSDIPVARAVETSTTTGTTAIALDGAVAQHQTIASIVQVGDPVEIAILDANGTAWEDVDGTLTDSTHISRDTTLQSSTGSAISLSAGTHRIVHGGSLHSYNKRLVFADAFIDYVVSGLLAPSTSANLTGSLTAGVAYVVGRRIRKGAQAHTYTANKDTYIDLSYTGALNYPDVANGGTAPGVTANSFRLAKVVTGPSTITSAVTSGKDNIGTNMRNTARLPFVKLQRNTSQTITHFTSTALIFGSGTTLADNIDGHSEVTNNTRITVASDGVYSVKAFALYSAVTAVCEPFMDIYVNGVIVSDARCSRQMAVSDYGTMSLDCDIPLVSGDYLEVFTIQASGASQSIGNSAFSVRRVS